MERNEKYGQALLDDLRARLDSRRKEEERREQNIADCLYDSSDCFLSSWACNAGQALLSQQIAILENGGLWDFRVLKDLNGNVVSTKLVDTKYGRKFVTNDGLWINPFVAESTLRKKGFVLSSMALPAWADYGSGITAAPKIFQARINRWTGAYSPKPMRTDGFSPDDK